MQVALDGNYCKKKGTSSYPRRCYGLVSSSGTGCEDRCNAFSGCIGYSYASSLGGFCYLYTRHINACPSGFTYRNGPVIMSIDDFEGYPGHPPFNGCYAKGKAKVGLNVPSARYLLV